MRFIKKALVLTVFFISFISVFGQDSEINVYNITETEPCQKPEHNNSDFSWRNNFLWDVDFYGLFDNREFKAPHQTPQTIFGARITPEIGLKFLDYNRVCAGISWREQFGENDYEKVKYVLYYKYDQRPFKITFGSFPRTLLTQELPDAILYDSLRFANPLIQGVLLQYEGKSGYAEAYIDWRSKQGIDQREIFSIVSNGRFYYKNLLFAGWNLMMNHYAKPLNGEGYNVVDNIQGNPYIGVNFAKLAPVFDSLQIQAGALISTNRDRGLEVWDTPAGFLAEFDIEWKGLGLHQTFYAGDNQLSLYYKYGSSLHHSDPFYQATTYSRTDIYYRLFRKSPVGIKALFNIHVADGTVQFQQQVIVSFNIGNEMFHKKKMKHNNRIKGDGSF